MNPKTQTTATNTPSPEDISEIEQHGKRKAPKPLKKLGWWAILVLPILVIVTYVTVMYVRNKDVYARVGTAVVTKAEFKNARAINERAAQLTKNEEVLKDLDGFTRKTLILQANLESEAKKNNVPISDTDIEEQILKTNKDIKKGSTPEDTIRAMLIRFNALYGSNNQNYPREDVLRQYRIGALKDKLANKILEYKDVMLVITRWDYFGGTTKYTQEQADTLSRATLEKKILPLMQQGKTDEEITAVANAGKKMDSLDISPETMIVLPMKGINKDNPGSIGFQDPKDWDTIAKLNNKNEYSDITKSEGGGFYFIARVSDVGTGSFKNWDDYTKSVVDKAVVYGTGLSAKMLISYNQSAPEFMVNAKIDGRLCRVEQPKKGIFGRLTDALLGARPALAACPGNIGANHKVSFGGIVTNSLGQGVGNVSITVTPRGPACPVNQPDATSPRQYTTNGGGWWRSGRDFSCYMYWKVIVSYAGCTYEAPMTLQSGANGTDDPNTWLVMDCVQRNGQISIEHWQVRNNGTTVKANIPQTERFGVNTCITDVFTVSVQANGLACNFNEAANATYTFDLVAQDYGVKVISQGGAPPKPAAGWVFDRFEVFYPCGGGLAGPWGYTPGGGPFVVATITVGDACVGGGVDTIVRTFYKQAPAPTVSLTVGGKDTGPGNPAELEADKDYNAVWTTGGIVDSCTASYIGGHTGSAWTTPNANLGNTSGARAVGPDSNVNDEVVTYKITCTGPGGSADDTVAVRYRRRFYPYIKTQNGDVSIMNEIKVSGASSASDKKAGSYSSTEGSADYVVMSTLSKYFCSRYPALFGMVPPKTQAYPCEAGAYVPENNPSNLVKASLEKYAPGSSNISCAPPTDPDSAKRPYDVSFVSDLPNNGKLVDGGAADKVCAKIWVINDSYTLDGYSIKRGRATVWVKGTLTIRGNVLTNPTGEASYTTNQYPNVAFIANNIVIEPGVSTVQAALYAYRNNDADSTNGKIRTCSAYPSPSCNRALTVLGIMGAEGGFYFGRNAVDLGAASRADRTGTVPAESLIGTAQSIVFPPPGFEDILSDDATAVKYSSGEANPRF